MRRYSPATFLFCIDAANSLNPFAMWPAFPASNYYGSSAPSRRHQPATDLPLSSGELGSRGPPGWFPRSLLNRSSGVGAQLCPRGLAMTTPRTFIVASLSGDIYRKGVLRNLVRMRAAAQPISARFELVVPF